MKAAYPLSDNQMAVREDIKSLMTMIEMVQVTSIESGTRSRICDIIETEYPVSYADLRYEVYLVFNQRDEDSIEMGRLFSKINASLDAVVNPPGRFIFFKKMFGAKQFGTLNELRVGMQVAYPSVRLQVPMSSFGTVDCMLLLPHRQDDTDMQTEMRITDMERYIRDNQLLSQYLETIDDASLRTKVTKPEVECREKTFVIYCPPNAGMYELMTMSDSQVIETYQKNGMYVLLWNYRGYGYSIGAPGMENIISDCQNLVKFVKSGFGAEKVVVYGRSIGGHPTKSVVNKVDLVIIDRSFSSISFVPRIIFGQQWVQFAYDLFIDNYQTNVKQVIESHTHKILLVDPCVDCI